MELKHIGRYDIKSLIGQGGMSAVYLGYDPRALREVAIKVLPPYYMHAEKFRERFEREALMIALLEHPAIVPVYDMGEEDGQPYIVMRYMSGGSLADKLKKGPIPLKECTDMYLRLAPALDTAHSRGVTHRDVKPDNLLFDKYDNVFLSDFGLARLRETIGFANISDGSIMGTPAYMSPEQIQGDSEIDGRSDIYSMGVVLYHMLCGSVPYQGTTAASVMMMHLINPVPQIYEQNDTLPVAVQAVLDIAMAKNPNDRYQTASEFAHALQAVTTGIYRKLPIQNIAAIAGHRPGKRSTMIIPREKTAAQIYRENIAAAKPVKIGRKKNSEQIEVPEEETSSSSEIETILPEPETSLTSSTSQPETTHARPRKFPLWGWILSAVAVVLLSLALIQWSRGGFPFSLLPASNLNPNSSLINNSEVTSTPLSPLTLGRADKVAFLNDSNIWASNLDGSDLTQLTTDGVKKSHLNWSPDGQSIIYTSGSCLHLVGLQTKQIINLTCITGISSISAFDISPDGQNVALGLAQSDLYLLPFSQLFNLRKASLPEDLLTLAQCSYYAPYNIGDTLKAVNWSLTDTRLAVLLSKLVAGTNRDEIRILDFGECAASPLQVKEIIPTYLLFAMRGYYNRPEIASLSWNGNSELLLNGYLNNAGFGDLLLYNLDQNQSRELTPNGPCCYRDAHWSPDGTYLLYSFRPEAGGELTLYYVPASELAQPATEMTALTLPAGFFASSLDSLQPALRTAH